MSQQLQITGGAKVRDLQDVIIGTSGVLSSLAFNVANGVPKLDVNGKILVSQLPNSVMEYQGTWNAATNTPTLVNGTGNQGDVYLCNVAGTTNFGAGPITFAVGDSAIYSGTIWQRAGGATGTVTSVGLTSTGNDAITITGSPITTSGNINLGFAGTNLQYINGAGDLTNFPTLISSIGLTMPSAFSVANSPLTSNGTIAVTGAGYPSQYIRGDGTLADFPTSGGGGSSVSYYLNGGTSQGTIGGVTYYEMSKTADTGTGVDFNKTGDGFIVAFLTDAGDPAQLNIPAGNWNYEIYASMSANGGTPEMYAELYKYDGTTFTLISTSSNEILYDGTNLNLYTFAMTVPATILTLTDRLAIKLYATNSGGKTTTVHTQDSHLCQIITTFSTGITALNGLTAQVQYFATGTSGTDFNISSTTATHTFNLPVASAANTGKLSSTDWSTFNGKVPYTGATANVDLGGNDLSGYYINGTQLTAKKVGSTGGALFIETGSGYVVGGVSGIAMASGSANNLSLFFIDATATNTKNAILNFGSLTNNTNRTYTLPDATGTLALTSDLGSYLPLAGGIMTGSILLNNNLTISGQLFGTSSYASMLAMSPSDKVLIDNSGRGVIFGGTIGQGAYTYTFPSATGTLALTSDLSSYVPLAGNVNVTGPLGINTTGGAGTTGLTNFGTFITRSDSTQGFPRKLAISMASGTLVSIDASGNGANYITDMAFSTSTASGLNATPAIYITGTNNRVGIKTGTPAYDLDVSGTGRFTGALTGAAASFGGNLTVTGNNLFTLAATNTSARIGEYDAANRICFTANQNGSNAQDDATKPSWGLVFNANSTNTAFIGYKAAGGGSAALISLMTIAGAGGINIPVSLNNSNTGLDLTNNAGSGYGNAINFYQSTTKYGQIFVESGVANTSEMAFKTMVASTVATRLFITSGGNVCIGTTNAISSSALTTVQATASALTGYFRSTASSSPFGIIIEYTGTSPNNTSNEFINCGDSSAARFKVTSNGNCYNVSGTYTSGVSDIKYKEQVVDANSQWDDIKNLRVVNFKFIKDVEENGDDALRHIGFIAQEVEKTSPNLIEEMSDEKTGETWKTIKTSIIHTKSIKALQEAIERIETLESTIQNLQEQINILAK